MVHEHPVGLGQWYHQPISGAFRPTNHLAPLTVCLGRPALGQAEALAPVRIVLIRATRVMVVEHVMRAVIADDPCHYLSKLNLPRATAGTSDTVEVSKRLVTPHTLRCTIFGWASTFSLTGPWSSTNSCSQGTLADLQLGQHRQLD